MGLYLLYIGYKCYNIIETQAYVINKLQLSAITTPLLLHKYITYDLSDTF